MASFRLFAGSELSLGTVLARRSRVLGNHPAVQNMLLAARAFSFRTKPRPLSACRPACTHMPCYRSAIRWDGLASTPHRALRCRLRGSVGGSLTGIVAPANRACAVLIDAFRSREEFTRRVLVNPDLISTDIAPMLSMTNPAGATVCSHES